MVHRNFIHFQGSQFTKSDSSSFSAGIAKVAGGDADSLMEEFKLLLTELGRCYNKSSTETEQSYKSTAEQISSVTSTMSDQCAVNPLFNKTLAALREQVLPTVYDNWDNLSEAEDVSTSKLFFFFCKMHLFVNMATEVDKCLVLFEISFITEGRNAYSYNLNESRCLRPIKTASKALTSHGCENSGVASHFNTYLKNKGIANKLITFRGHRFNHLLHATGTTYYHLTDIRDFLASGLT